MSNNNGFWDFAAFWEFFYPHENENKTLECPMCCKVFGRGNEVELINKEYKVFRCPFCEACLFYDVDSRKIVIFEGAVEVDKPKPIEPITKEMDISSYDINEYKPISLIKILPKGLISVDFKAENTDNALDKISLFFYINDIVQNKDALYNNLWVVGDGSTLVASDGIAIGETFTNKFRPLISALFISKNGVNFDDFDKKPIHIFLITLRSCKTIGDTQISLELKHIAHAARLLRDKNLVGDLLHAESQDEVVGIIEKYER